MTTRHIAAAILALCMVPNLALADILHVPGDYPTLEAAAAAAVAGDEIVLAPGIYQGPVVLGSLDITLRGAGMDETTIVADPASDHLPIIRFDPSVHGNLSPSDSGAVRDLTIVGYVGGDPDSQQSYRPALRVQGAPDVGAFVLSHVRFVQTYLPNSYVVYILRLASFHAEGCIFDEVSGEGGSLEVQMVNRVDIQRCIFERNGGYTAPLYVFDASDLDIENCVFVGTSSMTPNGRASMRLTNCLGEVRFCSFGSGGPDASRSDGRYGHLDLRSSNIHYRFCAFANADYLVNNVVADPDFLDAGDPGPDLVWRTADDNPGDLTPSAGSPLLDTADGQFFTYFDIDALGNPRLVDLASVPNTGFAVDPYADTGAIERQGGLLPCPADINGDGTASPADFSAWVQSFNSDWPRCDQNGDGACSPADFSAWVANFNAGCE